MPGGKLRVGMIAIIVLGGDEPVARCLEQKLGAAVEPLMYPNPRPIYKASASVNRILLLGLYSCSRNEAVFH